MKSTRHYARMGLLLAILLGTQFCPQSPLMSRACGADTLRPEVGTPLQAAQELVKQQKFKDALQKIQEADAVSGKTPYEAFIVERMRGAAALGVGDADAAAKAYDAVFASGRLSDEEQLRIMQSMAGSYYRARNYGQASTWVQRYQKAGGTDPGMAQLLIQSSYLNGDYAEATKDLQAQQAVDEKAGRTTSEEQLQLLASCYLKQGDSSGYLQVLEKLVASYPKKEYWADLLAHLQRKAGFPDRLSLDLYRLMLATGTVTTTSDFMEMAQLALQAGFPKEAQTVIAVGYQSGTLGRGAEADREQRLKSLADKQVAEEQKALDNVSPTANGDALVNTGYNLVIYKQYDKGLALIQQGIAKGNLRHPEDAKLHLGEALLLAAHAQDAAKAFQAVQGDDGARDLARLWISQSRHSS